MKQNGYEGSLDGLRDYLRKNMMERLEWPEGMERQPDLPFYDGEKGN